MWLVRVVLCKDLLYELCFFEHWHISDSSWCTFVARVRICSRHVHVFMIGVGREFSSDPNPFAHPGKSIEPVSQPETNVCNKLPPDSVRIAFQVENPKRSGSGAYDRFSVYRVATTIAEARTLGATVADIKFDFEKKHFAVLEAVPGSEAAAKLSRLLQVKRELSSPPAGMSDSPDLAQRLEKERLRANDVAKDLHGQFFDLSTDDSPLPAEVLGQP